MGDVWHRDDPLVLRADEGWTTRPGSDIQGDRFMISGANTGSRFALVTHPVEPGWFSPPHTHTREDEYSFEGGALPSPEATERLARSYGCEVDVAGTPAFLACHGLRPPHSHDRSS